jgi:hypothetical protein
VHVQHERSPAALRGGHARGKVIQSCACTTSKALALGERRDGLGVARDLGEEVGAVAAVQRDVGDSCGCPFRSSTTSVHASSESSTLGTTAALARRRSADPAAPRLDAAWPRQACALEQLDVARGQSCTAATGSTIERTRTSGEEGAPSIEG